MGRSTVHYTDKNTNNILKRLHNKLRPAGTPVQRVEYIIELLLLRIFEIKLRNDLEFKPLREIFSGDNDKYLFSYLQRLTGEQIKSHLNKEIFPFYAQILSKARNAFENNLPQKVLDNLVLIEEVFANSSFTTNVQSGNMSEIIGLISEIDETTILKTDILGDAIESALSETGGTQDIGLYRTPEHIRQMMVAITDPTFDDIIFDPACGTGGFLFDAYHYCIEKITQDNRWPSPKCPPSHPELNEYFKKYFSSFNGEMPDIDTANRFYREGISGIEYLGMIRKMAAINLYIRGLNPANILQGDSLQHYKPETDANSKTLILSNPPFGAERDQPAYPNVWQEYAKESETTILFVKLMFDLLKKGGRCAVIVSEGFLTWDKSSARAMRKILLEETNLKAIISLPQGVFVSKQGQGAKTSILYFEKGEPTKWVWYYKIENDGFTMGVNRKPIDGCQIPEIIETFHKYVKHGHIPPETKNSFVIPVEWIKTLDVRLKERIRKTTGDRIILKRNAEREKLQKQLQERKEKGRLTEDEYKEKLKSFDLITQNKIQNETSKEIEKAYLYSFNFQTYKSDLTDEQIKEWKEVLRDIEPENNSSLDEKYEKLKTLDVNNCLKILASFNPEYALEMDITRDILNKLPQENEKIKKLQEILRKGQKYPIVPLDAFIIAIDDKMKPSQYPDDEFIVLGVANDKGIFVNEKKKGEEINQSYYIVRRGYFCYNPYRVNVGSIGLIEYDYDNQIISGAYNVFKVDEKNIEPKYLLALFKSKRFLDYVNELATGGVRMDFKIDYLKKWKIPLPPLEIQKEIVEKIEKQKAIIEGADKILENWEVNEKLFEGYPKYLLSDLLAEPLKNGVNFTEEQMGRGTKIVNVKDIFVYKYVNHDELDMVEIDKNVVGINRLRKGDILFVRSSVKKEGVGYCALINQVKEDVVFSGFLIRARLKKEVLPEYALYYLRTKTVRDYIVSDRSPVSITNINQAKLENIKIPLPPLEIQQKIVEELDKEMEALEKVKLLKEKAEKRIEEIIYEIWGK